VKQTPERGRAKPASKSAKKPVAKGRVAVSEKPPRRARRFVAFLVGVGVLGAAGWIAVLYEFADVPEPNSIATAESVVVLDRGGSALGRIHAEADRVTVPLSQIPEDLRHAVIATEDRHFAEHSGLRPTSIVRAAIANALGRGVRQGGSTITQQYVKNAFVGNEQSLTRKVKEAVLAVKLERARTKDQILEAYLNTIYFGRGAYGVEAAAQTYFGRHVRRLTLAQSALLAGLIRAPEAYDPSRAPETARARRDAVIGFMLRDDHVTVGEAEGARESAVKVRARVPGGTAPHFLEDVRRELERRFGARAMYSGEISRVTVTLDAGMQRAAEAAVREVYDATSDPDVALVAIDPRTGAVRAMIGARDWGARQLNLATQARRQPGSTFKPAVLAAALELGIGPETVFAAPAKITLKTDGKPWTVANYDGHSEKSMRLRRATELSVNTVYAQLILKVGPDAVVDAAHRLGIRSRLAPLPSLALGTADVTPLELASVYSTFAARGVQRDPYMLEMVTGRDGAVLFRADPGSTVALRPAIADTVNDVLRGVIENGTGKTARIGRPAAGKTGTTQDHADAWFAGYTPDLATVVWNGYADVARPMRNVRGVAAVTGSSFPARIWKTFMRRALAGMSPAAFVSPAPTPTPTPSASPRPGLSASATPSEKESGGKN